MEIKAKRLRVSVGERKSEGEKDHSTLQFIPSSDRIEEIPLLLINVVWSFHCIVIRSIIEKFANAYQRAALEINHTYFELRN